MKSNSQETPRQPYTYNSHVHYSHILITINRGFLRMTAAILYKLEKIVYHTLQSRQTKKNTKQKQETS